jgi:hypothetical protein
MAKPRLTGRGAREKGLKFERDLIAYFKDRLGIDIARGAAGAQAFDRARGSTDLFGLPHLGVEAKRTETISVHAFRDQAKRNASLHEMPCVIHRRSRQPINDSSVILSLEHFTDLYSAFLRERGIIR